MESPRRGVELVVWKLFLNQSFGSYLKKTFVKLEKSFFPLNKFFIRLRAITVLAIMCFAHLLVNQITMQYITSKHNERISKRQKFIVVHPSLGLHPLSHHTTCDWVFFTIMQILYKQLQAIPFTLERISIPLHLRRN